MDAENEASGATARGSLIAAYQGAAEKKAYLTFWLPVLAVLWAACFGLAALLYPGYQLPNHDISDLGDPAMNPHGWWLWSLGMGIAAVMIFPPIAYACRRMEALTVRQSSGGRRLVSLGSMGMRCACLGMLGLALVPQGRGLFDLIHTISGVFAFGGVFVTLLFLWGPALFHVREMSAARWALFTVSAWWAVAGFLVTQGFRYLAYGEVGHDHKHGNESVFLHFSLWEWMLFASVTTSFALLVTLLPAKAEKDA